MYIIGNFPSYLYSRQYLCDQFLITMFIFIIGELQMIAILVKIFLLLHIHVN